MSDYWSPEYKQAIVEESEQLRDWAKRTEAELNMVVDERDELLEQRNSARAWAALWKRAAKRKRARLHTAAGVAAKYIMEASKAKDRVAKLERAVEQAANILAQSRTTGSGLSYRKAVVDAEHLLGVTLEGTSILDACQWQYDERTDAWQTGCGATWVHTSSPPADNEMLFCPFCSKRIDEGEEFDYEN